MRNHWRHTCSRYPIPHSPPHPLSLSPHHSSHTSPCAVCNDCIANTPHIVSSLDPSKWLANFLSQCRGKSPLEIAELLESNEDIEVSHQSLASEATSDVNHASNDNLHFISLVEHEGLLVECDGRKGGPVVHGRIGEEGLLKAAVRVVEEYMARDPGDIRFNMTALAASDVA